MLFPIVNKGITFNEIPNRIAVFFEFGGCRQKCKGCHSPHLAKTPPALSPLEDLIEYAKTQKEKGATAIVLLGGTNNKKVTHEMMITLIKRLSEVLPCGLYSGRPVNSAVHAEYAKLLELSWFKIGDYQERYGGMDNPNTNQRFLVRTPLLRRWRDCTYIFQKEGQNDKRKT